MTISILGALKKLAGVGGSVCIFQCAFAVEKTFPPTSFVFQLFAVLDPKKTTEQEPIDIFHSAPLYID